MTDEIKVEEQPEEVAEVAPTPEVPKKSMRELHKELQGKKKVSKKKIKNYSKVECFEEIKRLEGTGHQNSKYYRDVKKRALSL